MKRNAGAAVRGRARRRKAPEMRGRGSTSEPADAKRPTALMAGRRPAGQRDAGRRRPDGTTELTEPTETPGEPRMKPMKPRGETDQAGRSRGGTRGTAAPRRGGKGRGAGAPRRGVAGRSRRRTPQMID